ncbi:recombinase family protein [Bacillus sp. NPDC077027]|uniref:recombinase family protein n=1 Tax=Bacillus sp. NPDC077027 TaxID=3390548 RepID=UPI003CFF00A7
MGRTYGYMRISTKKDEQTFNRQEAQLLGKVDKLYFDRMSGAKKNRQQLQEMLTALEAGDTVLIVAIDRLSRSTKDLLEIVETIKAKGASLKSINDSWLDTTSENPMSEFLLTVMGALGQMERAMTIQRVKEGVQVAQEKGVKFGRPKANKNKVNYALELYHSRKLTVREISDITGISKATLYRKLKEVM